MTTAEIIEELNEYSDDQPDDEKLLLADGFEDAIIGTLQGCCHPTVVCYDYDLCIACLMRRGVTEEDAHEWMSYNVIGAYMGKTTPLFLRNMRTEER